MNFELEWTPEQEGFRKEVREWLEKNIPEGLTNPVEVSDLTEEMYQKQRDLGRRLGARGWLRPLYPKEYDGGGLSFDKAFIIEQELDRYELTLPPYYDSGGRFGGASILVWGTEEQKKFFLPPLCKGEVRAWQLLSEPEAGSDLANQKTLAVRDGNDYVINGQKTFIGTHTSVEWFWMLCCTNPKGKRHENVSYFMFPANLPGITIQRQEHMGGGETGAGSGKLKNDIYLDNVRVPAFNLVGGENQGWKVVGTHMELEHGGGGSIARARLVDFLFDYCRTTQRNGQPLSKDPLVRELLIDVYIDHEVQRLFGLRNFWLAWAHKPMSYEGSQFSYWRKIIGPRAALAIQRIMGPYTLTRDPAWAPVEGRFEVFQRSSIVALHPGGTTDIQRVTMARRIGIGRETREKAGVLA